MMQCARSENAFHKRAEQAGSAVMQVSQSNESTLTNLYNVCEAR